MQVNNTSLLKDIDNLGISRSVSEACVTLIIPFKVKCIKLNR